MSELYLYERRQRRTAITLLINMAVLLVMYLVARQFIEPTEASEQFFYWLNIAVPAVELFLLIAAIFFWFRNGTFRMAVSRERFEMIDPLFESTSFTVPVSEIVEIRQTHQIQSDHTKIMMYMQSGQQIPITQNYHYDRVKLYAALATANPTIRLPENAFRFK
ncbi:hypothetical protein K227x_40760 [Rubripirellula lacrimiformis]|uniref:DUF304 domain-containing protein n=1 Tax=Rubripirellula lacrimiformis TaxID=1930273 RepID=A0A517NEW4_9BACT|nr:hypothetical protein [Rubripirellula lacrimiformis]QDT05674.1 hypothetical protein K227x_40760 [Rubripirellula lacrimiformis]